MALEAKMGTKNVDGKEKPVFEVEFSNGTISQLEELANFLEAREFSLPKTGPERLREVVRISIGWLESLKEDSNKTPKKDN